MIKNILRNVIDFVTLDLSKNGNGQEHAGEWESLSLDDVGEGDFVTLSNRVRMHYITRGDRGDPIVLIHGVMDSTHNWYRNIDVLARNHRVWAIDLVGFGFSSRLTERTYTLKFHARTIREFLEAQHLERVSIAGHSLGGAVALQTAHDFPERVSKLVLIDPAAYLRIPAPVKWAARVPVLPRAIAHYALTSKRARAVAMRSSVADPSKFDANEVEVRTRHLRVKGTVDALLAMSTSPRESDLPDGLKKINAPALIIWGEKDLVLPKRHGERLVRDLPNARLVVVENAGHVPNQESPEIVNDLMVEFFA